MKWCLPLFLFVSSTIAQANPFDAFVGSYTATGAPSIRHENTTWCNRFFFSQINGLRVEQNTAGYEQSHVLHLQRPSGSSGHPIMEFTYTNELRIGGSYAKTEGDTNLAINQYGTWGTNPDRRDELTVSLENMGTAYRFRMVDSVVERGQVTVACHYEVMLRKN